MSTGEMDLPYQIEVIREIEHFKGRVLLTLDMGLGKTFCALRYLQRNPHCYPALVICPSVVKYNWAAEALRFTGVHARVCEGQKPPEQRAYYGVNLPSKLTIINFDILPYWLEHLQTLGIKTIIVDECFPADTPVLTDQGWLPIGTIVNDQLALSVASFNFELNVIEYRPVVGYTKKCHAGPMIKVTHEQGTLICTPTHKIWTENRGYIEAKNLKSTDTLRVVPDPDDRIHSSILQSQLCGQSSQSAAVYDCSQEIAKTGGANLPVVQEIVQCQTIQPEQTLLRFVCSDASILKNRMERKSKSKPRNECQNQQESQSILSETRGVEDSPRDVESNESSKSFQKTRRCCEDEADQARPGNPTSVCRGSRRERQDHTSTDEFVAEAAKGNSIPLDFGNSDQSRESETTGVSDKLQGRYWLQRTATGNRNRRGRTSQLKTESTGSEKRVCSFRSRVVCVEILEPEIGHTENNADYFVYDIEVEENHNFYAAGVLVHNCQRFQNSKTKWTKAGKILVQGVPQLLALSGTPMLNRPYELYPMLNMLWPEHYKSSWTFSQQYCNPKWKRWGWDHSGAANLDQLNAELLSLGMVRRRKRDVLKDLPEKVWRTVPMALSNEAEYREASTNFLGWLKRTATHKVHAASKAEQLTRITYLLQLIAKLKLRSVCDWAIEFLEQSDEKLILFCVHVEAARVLRKRIPFVSVGIDISMTAKQRHLVVEQFQTDPKVRLFVGTAASGVGINLTAASEVGIVELPWRPGDLSQWVDRSHGNGILQLPDQLEHPRGKDRPHPAGQAGKHFVSAGWWRYIRSNRYVL